MYYNFHADLSHASNIEKMFSSVLSKLGYSIEECNNSEYDVIAKNSNGIFKRFEIKYDSMASDTGNIAIEYNSRGKESGIEITQSDYWVQYFDNKFWIIETSKLKDIVKEISFMKVIGGDAGSKTMMYLIKCDEFKKCCCLSIDIGEIK